MHVPVAISRAVVDVQPEFAEELTPLVEKFEARIQEMTGDVDRAVCVAAYETLSSCCRYGSMRTASFALVWNFYWCL